MFIELKNVTKKYSNGRVDTQVLRGVTLGIEKGEFVAIMGRSGAGKSTCLYQMGLLDHPTSGDIVIGGVTTGMLSMEERTTFRLNRFGYVFQDYALLPEFTAQENVALPLLMQRIPWKKAHEAAIRSLEKVGLSHRLANLPSHMSGGEQQRVSIARAIAHNPEIVFADEPTANLDSESSKNIMTLFQELHNKGQTIVMVTHEEAAAHIAGRIIRLSDGVVVNDTNTTSLQL